MKSMKEIRYEIAGHRPVSDADAIEFVKRTLYSVPPPSGGILQLRMEYAHHGGISRVNFAMRGTSTRGYAILHSDNGSLDPFLNSPDAYELHVRKYCARAYRRTRDAATVAMFLQVARLEAARVGFRETDNWTY